MILLNILNDNDSDSIDAAFQRFAEFKFTEEPKTPTHAHTEFSFQPMEPVTDITKEKFIELFDSHSLSEVTSNSLIEKKGTDLLFYAAKIGHIDAANFLISQGVAVDTLDQNGNTPLFVATHYKQIALVDFLITPFQNTSATPLIF